MFRTFVSPWLVAEGLFSLEDSGGVMPRPEKVQAVSDIKAGLEAAQATFLTEYRGMTVAQLQKLRRSLRQAGAEYKVVKMSLARRAADELGLGVLAEHLAGPTGLAFANGDPVAAAKVLRDLAKENDKLVVKGGVMGGAPLTAAEITRLADVEPREVLLANLAGAAQAPLAKLAGLVLALPRNAASVLAQLRDKKEAA